MQLPVIAHRGQTKPYGSIPRINWLHPLARGLISYCYDTGSGPIDLVIGGQRTINNTAPLGGFKPSKYGSALSSAGGSTTAGSICTLPGSTAIESFGVTAPFSFACGFMVTVTPGTTTNPVLFAACDSGTNTPCKMGPAKAGTDDFYFAYANQASVGTATGLLKINQFQTLTGVADTATTNLSYVDGILRLSKSAVFSTGPAVTGAVPVFHGYRTTGSQTLAVGFVYYGAVWDNRALTASEVRLLHDDPYCFLIYPEDLMFSSLVGRTASRAYRFNVEQNASIPITRMINY